MDEATGSTHPSMREDVEVVASEHPPAGEFGDSMYSQMREGSASGAKAAEAEWGASAATPHDAPAAPSGGDPTFGTIDYGDAMHAKFEEYMRGEFPGVDFQMNTGPGQTGPDAIVVDGPPNLGFSQAELKPFTESGLQAFFAQEGRWGQTRLYGYDEFGNIFLWIP